MSSLLIFSSFPVPLIKLNARPAHAEQGPHASLQLGFLEWLADIIFCTAVQALDLHRGLGSSSQQDKWNIGGLFSLLDSAAQFLAINEWHHHIGQNQVRRLAFQHCECLQSVFRDRNVMFRREQIDQQVTDLGVVFNDQDFLGMYRRGWARRSRSFDVALAQLCERLLTDHDRRGLKLQWLGNQLLPGDLEVEETLPRSTSLSIPTCPPSSSISSRTSASPRPVPAWFSRHAIHQAVRTAETTGEVFFCDPVASVFHSQTQAAVSVLIEHQLRHDADSSADVCELDCIADQVGQHDIQLVLIGHRGWQIGIEGDLQGQAPLLGKRRSCVGQPPRDFIQIDSRLDDLRASGLNLTEFEQLVDLLEQPLAVDFRPRPGASCSEDRGILSSSDLS